MRTLALAILTLGLACASSFAQTPKDSWENLKKLQPGHKIKVMDMSLRFWDGRLVSVSDEAITIRELRKQREITVERGKVFRVTNLERSRRGRNALIGLLIGGAIGAPLGAAKASDVPATLGAAIMFGLLGGVGTGLGALVPSHPALYRAGRGVGDGGATLQSPQHPR